MKTTEDRQPFVLRIPPDIKAWVADTATKNDRSMNAQILRILRQHIARAEQGEAA